MLYTPARRQNVIKKTMEEHDPLDGPVREPKISHNLLKKMTRASKNCLQIAGPLGISSVDPPSLCGLDVRSLRDSEPTTVD